MIQNTDKQHFTAVQTLLQSALDFNEQELLQACYLLEEYGLLVHNYRDYLISEPLDPDHELTRIDTADHKLACALLTMMIRENRFCEGMLAQRIERGSVRTVLQKIKETL